MKYRDLTMFIFVSILYFIAIFVLFDSILSRLIMLLIFLAVILIINNRFMKTKSYRNQFIDIEHIKAELKDNLEVVNLGSNQPKFAFNYSDTRIIGQNWAVGPQSLEYDLRFLQQCHNYIKHNGTVIIPICPFSFYLFRYPDDKINIKYYGFFDKTNINNYKRMTEMFYLKLPVLVSGKRLVRIFKDAPLDTRYEINENSMTVEELERDAMNWIKSWKKQFDINDLENEVLSVKNQENINLNIAILDQIISFCIKHDFRPVIMILPVSEYLTKHISDDFVKNRIIAYINAANHGRCELLNYYKDCRFMNIQYYFNSFFLNTEGRKVFTKQVIDDLFN